MKLFNLKTRYKKIIADTITPVSVYLKIRDKFPNSLLLESSDYRANDNNFSYICCNPIASIQIKNEEIHTQYPDGTASHEKINSHTNVPQVIHEFAKQFKKRRQRF
jgi:anthranilate synthase component 1